MRILLSREMKNSENERLNVKERHKQGVLKLQPFYRRWYSRSYEWHGQCLLIVISMNTLPAYHTWGYFNVHQYISQCSSFAVPWIRALQSCAVQLFVHFIWSLYAEDFDNISCFPCLYYGRVTMLLVVIISWCWSVVDGHASILRGGCVVCMYILICIL